MKLSVLERIAYVCLGSEAAISRQLAYSLPNVCYTPESGRSVIAKIHPGDRQLHANSGYYNYCISTLIPIIKTLILSKIERN
jgi:hypothetical protein